MTTIDILLLVALVFAIVCDIVRIVQYYNMKKYCYEKCKRDFVKKMNRLYSEWFANETPTRETSVDYIIKHWEGNGE